MKKKLIPQKVWLQRNYISVQPEEGCDVCEEHFVTKVRRQITIVELIMMERMFEARVLKFRRMKTKIVADQFEYIYEYIYEDSDQLLN